MELQKLGVDSDAFMKLRNSEVIADVIREQSVSRPPEKVIIMPPMNTPTDGKSKKAPPPVAAKPSSKPKRSSSILKFLGGSRSSTSSTPPTSPKPAMVSGTESIPTPPPSEHGDTTPSLNEVSAHTNVDMTDLTATVDLDADSSTNALNSSVQDDFSSKNASSSALDFDTAVTPLLENEPPVCDDVTVVFTPVDVSTQPSIANHDVESIPLPPAPDELYMPPPPEELSDPFTDDILPADNEIDLPPPPVDDDIPPGYMAGVARPPQGTVYSGESESTGTTSTVPDESLLLFKPAASLKASNEISGVSDDIAIMSNDHDFPPPPLEQVETISTDDYESSNNVDNVTSSQAVDGLQEGLVTSEKTEEVNSAAPTVNMADRKMQLEDLLSQRIDVRVTITEETGDERSPSISSKLSDLGDGITSPTEELSYPAYATPTPFENGNKQQNTEENPVKENGVNKPAQKDSTTTAATMGTTSDQTNNSNQTTCSSDSGDSGVYSLLGETVQVKLRTTKNDNRKPDYSVPMFEKHSSDQLKRVTFRVADTQQEIMPADVKRSAKEEERVSRTGLSEDDVVQAEIFYKAHKTEVMVCKCLGTLYFTEGSSTADIPLDQWKPAHIGIPVLIYDTGNAKRARGLTLVFAEKGTGFSLWKTVINWESRFEVVEKVFHRLKVVGSSDKLAGIAYQDGESAQAFYNFFKECTSDPELNVLNNPHIKLKKKKDKKPKLKVRPPSKQAISQPCQFTHVTQLKQSTDGILAMTMVPAEYEESLSSPEPDSNANSRVSFSVA